jgi:hypothetical protein
LASGVEKGPEQKKQKRKRANEVEDLGNAGDEEGPTGREMPKKRKK